MQPASAFRESPPPRGPSLSPSTSSMYLNFCKNFPGETATCFVNKSIIAVAGKVRRVTLNRSLTVVPVQLIVTP